MKIAIHHRQGSFSDKWIEYCQKYQVNYKLVNCYDTDIINKLDDCDGLMWHWHQSHPMDFLFARQLIYSLEHIGKKVFPNSTTCWHFDDKVGQKYLLEANDIPLVPSYIFYDKKKALEWAKETIYPKVFKLRGGASSENVKLVKSKKEARRIISQCFGKGFRSYKKVTVLKELYWKFRRDKNGESLRRILKYTIKYFFPARFHPPYTIEKQYAYFQDYIPKNSYDIRIVIIGNRAFAIKRLVRKNDFRASGSGFIIYNPSEIPIECVKMSFELNNLLKTQCIAFDYVFNNNKPLLIEISYGFARKGYLPCPGYWNSNLNWNEGKFTPEWFMIEDFINNIDR